MCEAKKCEHCEKVCISLEEHEERCYRVYVKSLFAGVMWGFAISGLFVLRL